MPSAEPKVYADEEIDILLDGSRREIDRLLLLSLNSLASAFLSFRDKEFRPHVLTEDIMLKALGEPAEVIRRRAWLDLQIKRESERAEIRQKVLTSTLVWAAPVALVFFLGLMASGARERLMDWISPHQSAKVEQKK